MSSEFSPKSDFLRVLFERGFVHQCSDFAGLDALATKGDVIAYVGYDCTASSLHIGNLISAMMLHWLQVTGNKPITLMGSGTTRVGDPSGKDETRKLLTIEQIDANKDSIKGVFSKFLSYGAGARDAIFCSSFDQESRSTQIHRGGLRHHGQKSVRRNYSGVPVVRGRLV